MLSILIFTFLLIFCRCDETVAEFKPLLLTLWLRNCLCVFFFFILLRLLSQLFGFGHLNRTFPINSIYRIFFTIFMTFSYHSLSHPPILFFCTYFSVAAVKRGRKDSSQIKRFLWFCSLVVSDP